MELRTKIFAPRRFDDPSPNEDPEENIRHRRILSPHTTPYRYIKPVEYNPNLPPAAFPTIDHWLPRNVDTANQSLSLESSNLSPQGETERPSIENLPETRVPAQTNASTFSRDLSSQIPQRRRDLGHSSSSFSAGDFDEASEMEDGVKSNGPKNPVYMKNMEILEKMEKRTDSDWNIAEMETSSEEEDEEVTVAAPTVAQQANATSIENPTWDELPIPNQLDLINTLSEQCDGEQNAMLQLRLNPSQMQKMNNILARQQQSLLDEDSRIEALQAATNRILMTDNSTKARHMSQAKYRELMGTYLNVSDEENYYISTRLGLRKAKQYLQSCGYNPELLDHWTLGSHRADIDGLRSSQTSPEESFAERQEATQSIPATQSSRPGGSNFQDLVGHQPFGTSSQSAAMLPLPANTSRALQASNHGQPNLNVRGRIQRRGESSATNRDITLGGEVTPRQGRRFYRRLRTPTSRASQPPDRSMHLISRPTTPALIESSPLRFELSRATTPPPLNTVTQSIENASTSSIAQPAPSTRASFSSGSTLISPAGIDPLPSGAPPRKPALRLYVSGNDTAAEASEPNSTRESQERDTKTPRRAKSRPKIPAMLAELESSAGFRSEIPETTPRERSRRSRRTAAGSSPLKPEDEAEEKGQ